MPLTRSFAVEIQELGRAARAQVGASDVALAHRLKAATLAAEAVGRLLLNYSADPWTWLLGTLTLGFHYSVEAQLNHSIMHGAYAGLPGAGRFTPSRYETMALPMQSRTWGDAHRIHHAHPSVLELDPDTIHPLFRVHGETPWRPWHALNVFLGAILTFEVWAWDYDAFLKRAGHRAEDDRGELRKFLLFIGYQYVLFAVLAGPRWEQVLLGTLAASVIRNLIFTGLQTGSSVGRQVSTGHHRSPGKRTVAEWYRFQVETSKNFALHGIWRLLCGGLDRHIEHHLFPNLPPNRLHGLSSRIRELCGSAAVRYEEHGSFWSSLGDSLGHLGRLSIP